MDVERSQTSGERWQGCAGLVTRTQGEVCRGFGTSCAACCLLQPLVKPGQGFVQILDSACVMRPSSWHLAGMHLTSCLITECMAHVCAGEEEEKVKRSALVKCKVCLAPWLCTLVQASTAARLWAGLPAAKIQGWVEEQRCRGLGERHSMVSITPEYTALDARGRSGV